MKRTPLPRYKGLETRTGLQRQARISPVAVKPRTPRPQRRDTGFSVAVKLAIRTRAGNGDPDKARCEACAIWLGRHGGQCQHIIARGMGGSRLVNGVTDGVLLCGTPETGDHGLCEARDPHMRAMGFWRYSWERRGPIMLHGAGGGGVTVWLTPDGRYSAQRPEVAA